MSDSIGFVMTTEDQHHGRILGWPRVFMSVESAQEYIEQNPIDRTVIRSWWRFDYSNGDGDIVSACLRDETVLNIWRH